MRSAGIVAITVLAVACSGETIQRPPTRHLPTAEAPARPAIPPPLELEHFIYEVTHTPARAVYLPQELGLPEEALPTLPAGAIRNRWRRYRAGEDASLAPLTEAIDAWLGRAAGRAPAAALLLAGYLHRQREKLETDADSADARGHRKRAIEHLGAAKARAEASTLVGWYARYHLGLACAANHDEAGSRAELTALAAAGERPGSATILFQLAMAEDDSGLGVSAAARFRVVLQKSPPESELHRAAWQLLIGIELRRRRYPEALALALAGPSQLLAERVDVAAESIERLGGLDKVSLPAGLSPSIFAGIAARLADRAQARLDLPTAVRAWQRLLARAPAAPEATRAHVGLSARTLSAPVDDAALRRDLRARVLRLLRYCVRDDGPPHLNGDVELELELGASVPGRASVLATSKREDPTLIARWRQCLESSARAHFVTATRGVRVRVQLHPGH